MNQKKTALYCRVSTGNQSTGLEAQVRALRDYCTRKGISDYILYEDENQSGVKQSRPALDRMMTDVREGLIETVIVYSFSRYARSVTHLLRALEEFKKANVGFVSITESIETNTPLGSAVFVILSAVSQLERDILAERVRNGLANAKAKGVKLGRQKIRPSELLRSLRASGLPYREVARLAGTSQGSVSMEMREWKKEAEIQGKTLPDLMTEHRMSRSTLAKKNSVAASTSSEGGISKTLEKFTMTDGKEIPLSADYQNFKIELDR